MDNYLEYESPLPYIEQEEAAAGWKYGQGIGRDILGPRSKYFPNWHLSQLTIEERAEVREKIAALNAEIYKVNQEREDRNNHATKLKNRYSAQLAEYPEVFPVITTANCTQCKHNQLNTYKISEYSYFCECKECGICGYGPTDKKAFEDIYDSIWSQNI